MLKKHELHDRTEQPVVNRDTRHESNHGPVGCRSSNARQLGCVFQDMKPPKSILQNSSDMQRPIQRVKFTEAIARHTKIRDQNPSLGNICPGEFHQRSPNAPKFEDQEFDSKWDGILLSMTKIPPDDILEGLYKLRIRESDKLKTVLELYDLETHQKKVGPDYYRV